MDFQEFEITKREIIFSIIIISVMLIIGMTISSNISESEDSKNERYSRALTIDTNDLFVYGMNTNVGDAFVYGELKAIDPVSYKDVENDYIYIERVKEKYTKHIRYETYTTGTGKHKTTHTRKVKYWTWDYISKDEKVAKEVEFLGVTFDTDKFNLNNTEHIDTVSCGIKLRYVYYGIPNNQKGTIFTSLDNSTISNNNKLYHMTIDDTIDHLKTESDTIVFWVIWIIITAGAVFLFYCFENKWLE